MVSGFGFDVEGVAVAGDEHGVGVGVVVAEVVECGQGDDGLPSSSAAGEGVRASDTSLGALAVTLNNRHSATGPGGLGAPT
jgi:hypothetical protein